MKKWDSIKGTIAVISLVLMFIFGVSFVLGLVKMVVGLLFGGDSFLREFLDSDSDFNLFSFKFSFWATLITGILYFVFGGSWDHFSSFFRKKS